jgi:signal transduction histidine kinase/ligand-binding sensor domain-containing protein
MIYWAYISVETFRALWRLGFLAFALFSLTSLAIMPAKAQRRAIYAGEYLSATFTVEDGLPTNLVKDIQQDSAGMMWFATDAGLARFDGSRFQTYAHDLPSPYVKSLLRLRSTGALWAVTDLGVVEASPKRDTTIFRLVIPAFPDERPDALHYPKESFESRDGSVWFAEQQAVVRYRKGKLRRFTFPDKCHSRNAVVSFHFAEDSDGVLYISAYSGHCFRFHSSSETFEEIILPQDYGAFVHLVSLRAGEVLAAAEKGLLQIAFPAARATPDTALTPLEIAFTPLIANVNRISALLATRKNSASSPWQIFVGTWYEGVWVGEDKPKNLRQIPNIEPQRIKNFFQDASGNIWVCGDQGVILLEKPLARSVKGMNDMLPDMKSLAKLPNGSIIACTGQAAYQIDGTTGQAVFLYNKPESSGDFFALASSSDSEASWSGSLSGDLLLYRRNILEGSWSIHLPGTSERGIYSLQEDKDGNLWGCFNNSRTSVFCLRARSGRIDYYGVKEGLTRSAQVIRVAPDGAVYAGALGVPEEYLFRYNSESDKFENISAPFEIRSMMQLAVYDLAFHPDNPRVVYAATGFGLVKIENGVATRLLQDTEFRGNAIKAVAVDKAGAVWLGTDFGLVRYFRDAATLFHQAAGLRSRTIAYRGLLVDDKQTLWIATANGLFYLDCGGCRFESPRPALSLATLNGESFLFSSSGEAFNAQSYVQLHIAPGNITVHATQYRSRLYREGEERSAWSRPTYQPLLTLSNLESGSYILEISARSEGIGEDWSKPLTLAFTVRPPVYRSWWAYFLYGVCSLLIIGFLSLAITTARERKRIVNEARIRMRLQKMVDERTAEINRQKDLLEMQTHEIQLANAELLRANNDLQHANERLKEAANFKTRIVSIVSHDLKNPLGSLLGLAKIMQASAWDDEQRQIAQDMINIGEQTLALVTDLLDSTAIEAGKLELKRALVDVSELVAAIQWQYAPQAQAKRQKLTAFFEPECVAFADERRLRQVFENLISNAIKYSPAGKTIWLHLQKISSASEETGEPNAERLRFSVRDEGPGLTEEDKKRVFGHFEKLSARPTGGETSSGVGLSIVKQIVEIHGGKAWVESEEGKGATFIVEIPAVLPANTLAQSA